MDTEKKMNLFWAEVLCDKKSKIISSTIIIKAPTIDHAWKILHHEIEIRKHLINEVTDIRMVADGHKGVTIEETETHFWLFFDDKPVKIWAKPEQQSAQIKPSKELN